MQGREARLVPEKLSGCDNLLLFLSDPDFTSSVLFPPILKGKAILSLLLGWAERHISCLQQTLQILSFLLPSSSGFVLVVRVGGVVKMVLVEAA